MKQHWKGGNMVYPVPAVLVTCQRENSSPNVFTVAWCGTCCTNPPMAYISVRPERYSYDIIKETSEFVINLTTKDLVKVTDFSGVKSGRDIDKFKYLNIHEEKSVHVKTPGILESPVNIECRVNQILKLGSHHMFIADVLGVNVDSKYLDKNGKFDLNKADLIAYSHGEYYNLGQYLGRFGYSIKKSNK